MRSKVLNFAFILCCSLTFEAKAQNLLSDGGFESGGVSTPWQIVNPDANTRIEQNSSINGLARSGTYGAFFGTIGTEGSMTQSITTTAEQRYVLSFWIRRASLNWAGNINYLNVLAGGNTIASFTNLQANNGYINYQYTVRATSANTSISFVGRDDPDGYGIDDVSFIAWQPNVANTSGALSSNADALRRLGSHRLSILGLMSDYDCSTFSKHGACLTFQARYSTFNNMNEGSGVFIAAYRLTENVRLGTFIDYRASETEPTNVKLSNDLPTFGAFVGYSQHLNGSGLQGKLIAAVQNGSATVTRDNSLADTEPGSGKGSLNSYMISGELGWGFAVSPSMLATPYVGLRYTDATRGGYTEDTVSGTVDYPVSYSDYSQRLTTATIGVRLAGMLTEKVGYQIGAGIEHDLQQKTSTYSGTSTISGLETFAINVDGVKNRTRGVGSVGMFYQVEKNQRLISNVTFRNQAYTSQNAVSAMAGYQVAF